MRLGILKRKPVAISSRKKSADESKRIPKNVVENVSASAVSSEVHTTPLASLRPGSVLIIEWTFMQSKLGDILNDTDRLESGSLNESDGGEECEAILTALRRAKRRSERRMHQDWKDRLAARGDEMDIDDDVKGAAVGKTMPQLRLTLNGH